MGRMANGFVAVIAGFGEVPGRHVATLVRPRGEPPDRLYLI